MSDSRTARATTAAGRKDESAAPPIDLEAALQGILKRYDRIGFGRRGVLDAQQDVQRLAAELSPQDHERFRRIVMRWIDADEAERVTARLHYNLPEHLQALAIRLCASVPIPESVALLRRLDAAGAFAEADARLCRDALQESLNRLSILNAARES